MARKRITLSATMANDAYNNVAAAIGLMPGRKYPVVEGALQVLTFGLTFFLGVDQPATTTAGQAYAVSQGLATDRADPREVPLFDLSEMWVRNTVAGSNGTVVVVAVIDTGDD